MADTTFVYRQTPITADWLNDVNDTVYTDLKGPGGLSNTTDTTKGDNLVGVKRTETNAAATTLHFYVQRSKVRLTDFLSSSECDDIISGTGSIDVTTKFNNAISDSAGKTLLLPPGTIKVTGALNLSSNDTALIGDGIRSTKILSATNNVPILNVTGTFVHIEGLKVGYSVSPISGATGIKVVAQNTHLNDILVETTYTGIQFGAGGAISGTTNTAGGCRMRAFQILDHVNTGLLLWGTLDTFIADGLINAASTSNASLGNIRILDGNEAFLFRDMDVLLGVYPLTMDATVNGIGTRPAYGRFVNIFFDSAAREANVQKTVNCDFLGTWFSNGRSGGGYNGLSLFDCDSLDFIGGSAFNCGADGVYVDGTSKRISFTGMKFDSNSVTAGSGVKHGIEFGTGCTDFSVYGGTARNGLGGTAYQSFGVAIGSGCSQYNIEGVNTRSNVNGGVFDGSNAITGVIRGCPGYTTQAGNNDTVAVGTSSKTVTHGLAGTPTLDQIFLVDASSRTASGISSVWISNITSTTFQVNTNTNVTTTAYAFAWRARINGA